jgi:hypothetical protein
MQSSIKLPQSGPEFPYDFLLDGLDFDGTDAETITAYQHVVANLNLIDQSPSLRYIMSFPTSVSRRFVSLLAAEDPRTMAIVGYFFVLLRKYGSLWWMGAQAAVEFRALMKLIPDEWRPKMEWAVPVFEQDTYQPRTEARVC